MSNEKQTRWVYEKETQTIRTIPGNHWIASMNSWDSAVDNEANGALIAAAPTLYKAILEIRRCAINTKIEKRDILAICLNTLTHIQLQEKEQTP